MSVCAFASPTNSAAGWESPNGWRGSHRGPPLAIKAIIVVLAFLICKPLAFAALAFFLLRAGFNRGFRPGFGPRRSGKPSSGNSAFEAWRQDEMKRLDEEAQAFTAFTEQQRQAEQKEAFDRFRSERGPHADSNPQA